MKMITMMNDNQLQHHGIQNMHWGERHGPPYPLSKALSQRISKSAPPGLSKEQQAAIKSLPKARTSNLGSFGKSEDTNTLYITGFSGSGKSTLATAIARPGVDCIIHLDAFTEPITKETKNAQDAEFVKHLDTNLPEWRDMANAGTNKSGVRKFSGDYWSIVDRFRGQVEDFSRALYKDSRRVIVEGIQLGDGWYSGNNSYYTGMPFIVMPTSGPASYMRAVVRDGVNPIKKTIDNPRYLHEVLRNYKAMNDALDKVSADVGAAKAGAEYISALMSHA